MVSPSLTDQPWFVWGVLIVLGFPFVVVLAGELHERLRRRRSPLAAPVRTARNVLLPATVSLLFVLYVLEADADTVGARIGITVVAVLALALGLSFIAAIVFSGAGTDSWRGRAPKLFVDLLRFATVLVGGAVVIGAVWGVSLGGLFAALGVTGIVVGLALQDTLASLMGGIALLSEKPFVVGDWVEIDGTEGKVTDINWRTVRVETREEDLVVIPNIVFGTTTVLNNSRPDLVHIEVVPLGFSYDDPPGRVRQVIEAVARQTPGVLLEPAPVVRTVGYGDSSVDYEAWIHIATFDEMPDVRSDFLTRVWYAAQRERLTIPFPMRTVHHVALADVEATKADGRAGRIEAAFDLIAASSGLRSHFDAAVVEHYTTGEHLLRAGGSSSGLGLIVRGHATATVRDDQGVAHQVLRLGPGDFFGEQAAFRGRPNRFTVQATTDIEAIVLPAERVRTFAAQDDAFAVDMEELLTFRTQAADRAVDSVPLPRS